MISFFRQSLQRFASLFLRAIKICLVITTRYELAEQ